MEIPSGSFKEVVSDFEIKLITAALIRARYNQKHAAALLELSYDQFRGIYSKYRDQLDLALAEK